MVGVVGFSQRRQAVDYPIDVVANARAPTDDGLTIRDIWLLRLRALLAQAHGDAMAYADFRDGYRDMARTLGYEGISRGPRRCRDAGHPGRAAHVVLKQTTYATPISGRPNFASFQVAVSRKSVSPNMSHKGCLADVRQQQ